MFTCFTPCVEFLMLLLSINSEELVEMAATSLISVITVTQLVLTHPHNDLWLVLNSIIGGLNSNYQIHFCFEDGLYIGFFEMTPKKSIPTKIMAWKRLLWQPIIPPLTHLKHPEVYKIFQLFHIYSKLLRSN